jgi:DNA polymerase-3 subunit delta'
VRELDFTRGWPIQAVLWLEWVQQTELKPTLEFVITLIFASLIYVGFHQFAGNANTVRHLREAIAAERMPPALILAGPRGAGKYTLAIMLAQTMACLKHPLTDGLPDFCGVCSNCSRIGQAQPLADRVNEAIAAREELREVDKKETRVLIQTHPDVVVIPPDPPQLLIKIGQVRTVMQHVYRLPADAPRAVYIFTSTAFMKEAANSLLKILEEPPAYAHIFLLAENTGELLPTIRSRASIFRLGALPPEQIEALLAEHRGDWKPNQRSLVARLAEGAVGQAIGFDLEGYLASRQDALVILYNAASEGTRETDYGALFRVTETYRAGADGQQKTSALLHAFASLLEDLLLLHSGTGHLIRNIDLMTELKRVSETINVAWIEAAVRGLDQVEQGMRRNLLRSLSLDSFAVGLSRV